MKKADKKLTYIIRTGMTCLTIILIVLFFLIMSLVGKIQGTARVVNYAGLVRGGTQKIIKLENAGEPQDDMIETISSYIDGLRNGSSELNFIRLDDPKFQNKMEELDTYFQGLKEEIDLVRENGYENTQIIEKSDHFFQICDEATGYAEAYSQKKATALNKLEKIVIVDIICLIVLIGIELIKALHYATQNRLLQKKVYLDEATGLPNKNKCEEILNDPEPVGKDGTIALCVFDLNNLRTINNNLGHDKGDEYIRSFAVQMRQAVPEEYFAGRDGGDEFIVVLKDVDHAKAQECLNQIRSQTEEYSRIHPEMPISYAAGYALSSDFDECTMKDLFRQADKNMYIDKNRAKMREAAEKQKQNLKLLAEVRRQGFRFSDCLYCDVLLDQYRVLRVSSGFFLADDGSYTGAVEQILQEISSGDTRKLFREKLAPSYLNRFLNADTPKLELPYEKTDEEGKLHRGRITLLFNNATEDGRLHHFLVGFKEFNNSEEIRANEKLQLSRYYEQMKQSILENGNYVDALLETAQAVYTVDLTNDCLEKVFYHEEIRRIQINVELPCSYDAYCRERSRYVMEETQENYRIVDSSAKLLERFAIGEKQVTVEYQELDSDNRKIWFQKTVLMSQETVYDAETQHESTIVQGIILFRDTSVFHEKEQQEKERLQVAFEEADSASRAKTEFLNRMSHDIRTPINGIMGMLEIIRRNRQDEPRVEDCLNKIQFSTQHLLALVNDVLDMSRIESGKMEMKQEPFDLEELMNEVSSLVEAQVIENGLQHFKHRGNLEHTHLLGGSLQLRRIMVNLLSNAIKYNKEGGQIDTYAKEVSADGETAVFEFQIVDTGIGMSEEFIKNEMFKPFTQETSDARTQYRGTGLGMSIVKGLLEEMQGSIQVQSVPGDGTTITFRLPFKIDQSLEKKVQEEKVSCAKDLKGLRVLVVEDNDINMEISEFYLTDLGAEIEKAWNGKEAVEKFAQSEPGTYDVILMDLMMPVMNGLDATKKIRAMERPDAEEIPILAMTAQTSETSEAEGRTAGMNGYIRKPVNEQTLLEAILGKI